MLLDSAPTSILLLLGNSDIPFVIQARSLGITISSNTIMDKHVTNIWRSAYTELWRISSIYHLLTLNATKTLLSAFVLSELDYCNSPLCSSPQFILDKLRSTKFCCKISHEILQVWSCTASFAQPALVTSPLKDWLQVFNPVLQHFHQLFPVYIVQLLSIYTPSRHLRSSSDTCTLHIPFIKIKSFGQRAFSFTCPTQWNLLPSGLWHSKSSAFKTALKTHLFRSVY